MARKTITIDEELHRKLKELSTTTKPIQDLVEDAIRAQYLSFGDIQVQDFEALKLGFNVVANETEIRALFQNPRDINLLLMFLDEVLPDTMLLKKLFQLVTFADEPRAELEEIVDRSIQEYRENEEFKS